MSQVVRIRVQRTQMTDKEFLLKALEDLGYTWREGKLQLGLFGLFGPEVDIKVGGHELKLGFRKQGNTYELVENSGASRTRISEFLQKVSQRYIYHTARAKLEKQGFTLASEEVQEGDRIHLVLRRTA